MKSKLKSLGTIGLLFGTCLQLHSQGYIVPNGVVYVGLNFGGGYEVDVSHDPTNATYTGFLLKPKT